MRALTQNGNLAAVSTRDVNGWTISRRGAIVDVGVAGSGYRIYGNGGRGPVNFETELARLSTNSLHWRTKPTLPGKWEFVVRVFNEAGSEFNLDRRAELNLDENGNVEPERPRSVQGLSGLAAAGGKVQLSFTHDGTDEDAVTTHFHVYDDGGTGEVDYGTRVAEITRAQGKIVNQVYVSAAYPAEPRRFAVRSATAEDVEDEGMGFVEVTPVATGPTQPENLSGRVIH